MISLLKNFFMRNLTHEFEEIEITIDQYDLVAACTIDGIKGKKFPTMNRRVFNFQDKFVVKFDSPRGNEGAKSVRVQNLREVENYKLVNEADRKYFAAILRTGRVDNRFYVVQEYVPTTRRFYKKHKDELYSISKKYNIGDFWVDYESKSHHNIAVNKDGFKFFDLGFETNMRKPDEQIPLF